MPREPDANGPAYLRTYRSLDRLVTREQFLEICVAQGLPAPTKRMFDHVRGLYRQGEPNYLAMNTFDQQRKARRDSWSVQRIDRLITEHHPETERLEFKVEVGGEATTKKPWAAMANAGGGDILYGVAEASGEADHVQPVSFDGIEERFQQLNSGIDPPVTMAVVRLPTGPETRGVVCVRVAPASPGVVHFVDHRAPVRSGTTTRYMTAEEIRRWIREEQRPGRLAEQLTLALGASPDVP